MLIEAVRRRPSGAAAMSVLSVILGLVGIGLFMFPFFTDVYAGRVQTRLEQEFESPQMRQIYLSGQVKAGQGLTRIAIPKLGVQALVVEGTSPAALRAGAGHYENTPLPGQKGNVGIAGHRTTYGKPFSRMDELRSGDLITLETPVATYTYQVVDPFGGHGNPWITVPEDWSVVAQDVKEPSLTLTSCHPKGSAKQRIVLRARLIKSVPKPA